MVAAAFGPACEVVVHDLSQPERSVVHVAGEVTGRTPGAPATDLLLKCLRDGIPDHPLYYDVCTADGRTLRSSSVFLTQRGVAFGAFCVNVDVSDFVRLKGLLDTLIRPVAGQVVAKETFARNARDVVANAVLEACGSLGRGTSALTRRERRRVIEKLHREGVFQLKKAPVYVAEVLGVSRFTVYSDLKAAQRVDATA